MRDDDRISAHLDGELDELSAVRFARDVERDPALRDAVDALRAQREHLRALADAPGQAPSGFADRVMADLDTQEGPIATGWPWRPFALAAAAVLVLWAALPGPGRLDPAAAPERPPVSTEGVVAVVLAAPSYRLAPATVDGPWDVLAVRKAVESAGGALDTDGEVMTLVVPAARWAEVERALAGVGDVTPSEGQVPFTGVVRVPLELVP